ncbi:MAG TPA: hypothetical protein VLB82_08510, partial [Thermodesulfobacteriota bacterium]|nr:hypothetical protein [Thermodesulfobacteriota bacterium]
MNKENIEEFIIESNAIEKVYSKKAIEDTLEAWGWLNEECSQKTFGLMDLLIVHKIIMKNQEPVIAGKLRAELKIDVQVGGREA